MSVIGLHFYKANGLAANSSDFSRWIHYYKDGSYEAIKVNLNENTMPVFGSSEFHHCKKSLFHPTNLFRESGEDVMLLGAAYTQSLFHATLLGAIEPDLKNRKVVLLVSPPWCKRGGVPNNAFAARFSESHYLAMLKNPNLSKEIKETIAEKSVERLKSFPEMKERVLRYNRLFLKNKGSIVDRILFPGRKLFIGEKDKLTVSTAVKMSKIRRNLNDKEKENPHSARDKNWYELEQEALKDIKKEANNNSFYMKNRYYTNIIKSRLKAKRNSSLKDSYRESPEYSDLEVFLKICKERNIEANLVILPINDYWYDYTGFPKSERDIARTKITEIAKNYGAQIWDLYDLGYEKYFFVDTVHPSEKGWVKINEAIYQFYRQS